MYEVKRRKPGRHWFALLTCLLLMSLAAPTLWEDGASSYFFGETSSTDHPKSVAQLDPIYDLFGPHETGTTDSPTQASHGPVTVLVASTKVEAPPRISQPQREPGQASGSVAAMEIDAAPPVSNQVVLLPEAIGEVSGPLLLPKFRFDATTQREQNASTDSTQDPAPLRSRVDGWPLPHILIEQLDRLAEYPEVADWAFEIIDIMEALGQVSLSDTISADLLLQRLEETVGRSRALADSIQESALQSDVRRVAYAVSRRTTIWSLANQVFTQDVVAANDTAKPHGDRLAMLPIDSAKRGTLDEPVVPGGPLFRLDGPPVILEMEPSFGEQYPPVAPLTRNPTERVTSLLSDLERFEVTRLPSDGRRIARHIDELVASPEQARRFLAEHLDNHYRNANFRLNITSRLLDQLLPVMEPQEGHVDDYINGTPVWGWQETVAKLHTEFVEDPAHLRLRISAKGVVSSDTEASRGPATLSSVGRSDYEVSKTVVISQRGLGLSRTTAYADSNASLTGVETDYDNVPFLRNLAENIARKKYDEEKWQAMAEVDERVAREARQRFESEFTPKILDAARMFHARVWTPLVGLELDPTAVEMRTKPERFVTRFRVGATDQLAAHTARPRAPSDSLASMQIHETLLNNALDQFELDGKTFTLPELHRHISERMDQPKAETPQDFDKRVKISFSDQDAVRVRCEDGAVELTLCLAEISRGRKHRWNNLVVKARYKPEGTGLQANLVRQDSIELTGEDLLTGDQIALRGVFSKLLSRSRFAVLVPKHIAEHKSLGKLEVIQFAVKDGWIVVAIGPRLPIQAESESEEATARVPRWRLGKKKRQRAQR